MAINVTKPSVNLREKLNELETNKGIKGNEILQAETAQEVRSLIGAGRKNLIINGGFDVWQRGTSFPTQFDAPNSASNGADRWRDQNDSDFPAGGSVERAEDAPANKGFKYSEKVTCTDNTALSSNDYAMITQLIESQNVRALESSDHTHLTISFWVKANYTGKHSFNYGIWNATAQVERYHTSYDINTANTWEKKTIVVSLSNTNPIGQHTDTFQGFDCVWVLGTDAARFFDTTLDAWQTTEVRSAISQSDCKNFFDTVGNTFQITGVQLELGSVATDFEHRSYGEELALCQRYYQQVERTRGSGNRDAGTNVCAFSHALKVEMRTTPTMSFIVQGSNHNFTNSAFANVTSTSVAALIDITTADSYWYYNHGYKADAEL